jgi:hypothetical protein
MRDCLSSCSPFSPDFSVLVSTWPDYGESRDGASPRKKTSRDFF